MAIKIGIFSILCCILFPISVNAADIDCSSGMATGFIACRSQPSNLKANPEKYSAVTTANPNPCCLLNCAANATHDGTNCVCQAGYFSKGNGSSAECTACPTGSYLSSNGTSASCTVCEAGKYNTGTANTFPCPYTCNKPGASTYKTPKWNDGKTVETCEIDKCDTNYHLEDGNCVSNTYTIKFNGADGGSTTNPDVTCNANSATCRWTTNNVSKEGAIFRGWARSSGGSVVTYSPHNYFVTPAPAPKHGDVINLYTIWQNCSNDGANQALEWGSDCTILSCKPQYYLSATEDGKGACKICDSTGYFCPGGKDICTSGKCLCEKGYYCPGDISSKPSNCDNSGDNVYTGRCKCPLGSTTSGTGTSASSSCYRASGSSGTKYCDKNGCFYLNRDIFNR